MSIITKGLGASSLLITQGYGRRVTITELVDPYCTSISPYAVYEPVYMPFSKIGTCLSEIGSSYDTIKIWLLQPKLT